MNKDTYLALNASIDAQVLMGKKMQLMQNHIEILFSIVNECLPNDHQEEMERLAKLEQKLEKEAGELRGQFNKTIDSINQTNPSKP